MSRKFQIFTNGGRCFGENYWKIVTLEFQGVTKCESKIELRAVLLSCPAKDSGCDDDDPLSQAMKAEEAQILPDNSKNFESIREEKERGFPNAIKDCKRKLIITLKVKNSGKIPCDDEYIVVDHVFDPVTGGKGRLLSPVVLKLRQEQMIQLYRLQFQRVVNSDPFEEQREGDKVCSVDPDSPTCGIAMYDGKPIPYSEGFCCSCDPSVNAKRQLSPLLHGDSFLYRDSKLISQGNNRFTRQEKSSSSIVNPELVKLKSAKSLGTSKNPIEDDDAVDKDDGKDDNYSVKELSLEKMPNFLLQHDRKVVCEKGHILTELCKMQDDKNKEESEATYGSANSDYKISTNEQKRLIFDMNTDYVNKNKGTEESDNKNGVNVLQDCTTGITSRDLSKNNPIDSPVINNLNKDLMLKNLIRASDRDHTTRADYVVSKKLSDASNQVKSSQLIRGKRENRQKPSFSRLGKNLSLEEKLEKFARTKNVVVNRRKRLLELSHKRFHKAEIRCRDTEDCKTDITNFPEEDYVKAPPPKYFFCHDKNIIDPQESTESTLNSTCRAPNGIDFENSDDVQKSPQFLKTLEGGGRTKINVGKDEKPTYDTFFKSHQKVQKDEKKDKFQKGNLVGKVNSNKERVTYNMGGKIENNIEKIQNEGSHYRGKTSQRNDKRFKIDRDDEEKESKEEEDLNKDIVNDENRDKEKENSVNEDTESSKFQKSRFDANNVKNVMLKSDNDKKSVKPKIRNFLIARNWERLRSDLSKNDEKEVNDNETLDKDKESKEPVVTDSGKDELMEREIDDNKKNDNNLYDQKEKEKENEFTSNKFEGENEYKPTDESNGGLSTMPHSNNDKYMYNLRRKQQFNREPLGPKEYKEAIESNRENQYMKSSKGNNREMQKKFYPLRGFSREKPDRVAFNIEVIRKQYPETSLDRYASLHFPEDGQFFGQQINSPQTHLKENFYNLADELKKKSSYVRNRQNPLLYYKQPQKYYILENDRYKNSEDVHFIQNDVDSVEKLKNHHYYTPETSQDVDQLNVNPEPSRVGYKVPSKYESHYYRKPVKHYYPSVTDYSDPSKKSSFQRSKQNLIINQENGNKVHNLQSSRQNYPTIFLRKSDDFPSKIRIYPYEKISEDAEDSNHEKIRVRREVEYSFEPAKGFFRSELESGENEDYQKLKDKIVHELKTCLPRKLRRKSDIPQENWTKKMTGWQFSRMEHDNLSFDSDIMTGLHHLQDKFNYPLIESDKNPDKRKVSEEEERGQEDENVKLTNDKKRLIQSYLNAPNYVLEELEAGLKGKRQTSSQSKVDLSRGNHKCEKEAFDGEYSQDTAHCMRFGDLWYSVYLIKKPVVAQIVEIQLFDKHSLCDGTTQWRDLTKGKMIRLGTFLPKAEDELPTISMTFMGEKTKKVESAIDPDNYLLLIPSHLSDPSKANFYPQFDGGPEEYLVVNSKDISSGGDCNMIGTSFEAFARQPDRCTQPRGSCLKRQPVDLWREDMEARIKGKKGKYFVENFGTVPNSPVKTFTNFTGEYLALEYYGEYTSTIEIEVKADYNAIIRKGSNAQIPAVYIDSTYPKKTRIILSVLNIGLTSSYFRPRLGDCPPDLDPVWCPLEGPLVIIPPQQRHDFKLDLSGVLPPYKIHVTVQVLNQLNRKVAYRKILIKRGERCLCAFHCRCSCIGNLVEGRTCRKLSLQEYRGAGYVGSFPFRGGATSASESILSHISIIFGTAGYLLLLMGVLKAVLGLFFRRIGISGTRVIVGPRKLCRYYEYDLHCCSVLFDECGFPIHPTTCQPVQIVPLWLEFLINVAFFFLYPLRGIWFLILSFPCCKTFCADCDGCCRHDEIGEDDNRCSRPLLEKNLHSSCVNYNLTTVNTKKSKADDYLPYVPYKGDDDPLEEDDTEFVLQEMKRYRKK